MLKYMENYSNSFIFSYLPLLPVLDVLEGRAGVCAFDGPAKSRRETGDCAEMIISN